MAVVGELCADQHRAARCVRLVDEAEQLAAEAVADDGDRLAGKAVAHVRVGGARVEQRPIAHFRARAVQRGAARAADAAVVIGQRAQAAAREEAREAAVERRRSSRGAVDDDRAARLSALGHEECPRERVAVVCDERDGHALDRGRDTQKLFGLHGVLLRQVVTLALIS